MNKQAITEATLVLAPDGKTLGCQGDWTIAGISELDTELKKFKELAGKIATVNGTDIKQMDSAGALFLQNLVDLFSKNGIQVKITGLTRTYQDLIDLVGNEIDLIRQPMAMLGPQNWFYTVGEWTVDKYIQTMDFLGFFGEFLVTILQSILHPRRFQWRSTIAAIDTTGYQALPIVALMAFLIGVVLVYQLAEQLRMYGANIFIVDVTGIAILREFAPLITSIIIAGRSATSFAALIGTMKVNEEIDALRTMGLSPMERLVTPRVIGLIIALPFLVVWADAFGVLGSMVMAKNTANIGFHAFLERFEYAVKLKQFILGLVKAPVFAMIIAGTGCFQGFQVEMKSESVGQKTTKAAVQTIFLIIVVDAMFSVIFSKLGF